jgi:hypothetical protein
MEVPATSSWRAIARVQPAGRKLCAEPMPPAAAEVNCPCAVDRGFASMTDVFVKPSNWFGTLRHADNTLT